MPRRLQYDDEPDVDFGEPLGFVKGVPANSNIDDSYFSGESTYCDGIYSGYKYQCVEYARRFLLLTKGVMFSECRRASEIFEKDEVVDVETGNKHRFVACKNGETTTKPEVGMILVYPFVEKVLPWGHVAVVSAVGDDWVGIAEQNQLNKAWKDLPYGRKVNLIQDPATGAWTMEETLAPTQIRNALGWMHVENKPDRPSTSGDGHFVKYAPLHALAEFKTPRGEVFINRWEMPKLVAKVDVPELQAILDSRPTRAELGEPAPGACWPGPVREGHSLFEPSEVAAVGAIPAINHSFTMLGESLKIAVAKLTDQELSVKYSIPIDFVPAARRQLGDYRHGALTGGIVVVMSEKQREYHLAQSRLDTMEHYGDLALAKEFCDQYGQEKGWKMSTSNEEMSRAVALIARRKHHLEQRAEDVNTTVYFLDLTHQERLPASALPKAHAEKVARERLHVAVAAKQYAEHVAKAEQQLAAGEISDEDLPAFAVRSINLHDESVAIDPDGAITVDGVRADFIYKIGPWAAWFSLYENSAARSLPGFAKFEKLMKFVANDNHVLPTVFQPLWAHIFDQPIAVRDCAVWMASDAPSEQVREVCSPYATPVDAVDESGKYVGPLYRPPKTGPMKQRFRADHTEEPVDVSIALLGFIINGLHAAGGIYLEARRRAGEGRDAKFSDAVHPSATCYAFGQDLGAEDDEKPFHTA